MHFKDAISRGFSYLQNITFIEILVFVCIIALVFITLFSGLMVNEKVAINCLQLQGYSNIQVLDRAWFMVPLRGGGQSDSARFHMRAVNPAGQEVELYVFSGWLLKGATIRTY